MYREGLGARWQRTLGRHFDVVLRTAAAVGLAALVLVSCASVPKAEVPAVQSAQKGSPSATAAQSSPQPAAAAAATGGGSPTVGTITSKTVLPPPALLPVELPPPKIPSAAGTLTIPEPSVPAPPQASAPEADRIDPLTYLTVPALDVTAVIPPSALPAAARTQPGGSAVAPVPAPPAAATAPASNSVPMQAKVAPVARSIPPQAAPAVSPQASQRQQPPPQQQAPQNAQSPDVPAQSGGSSLTPAQREAALGSGPSSGAATVPAAETPAQREAAMGNGVSMAGPGAAGSVSSQRAVRRVYARRGDDITIGLDGLGWIFLGGSSGGNEWKGGLAYDSRSSDAHGTTFVFRAKALGDWSLLFQQQDAVTGTSREEAVDVSVLTDTEFARLMSSHTPSAPSGAPEVIQGGGSGDLTRAETLLRQGRLTEALDELERNWKPNDPALTQKIAALAYRVGRYEDAKTYWQKNLDAPQGAYGDLAVAGLVKTAVAMRSAPELRGLLDQVRKVAKVPISTELLGAGRFLFQNADWGTARSYLDEFMRRYPNEPGADAACYLLGQLYQNNTPLQNMRTAMTYYRRIVDDFPTSDYYELAQANIVYLNRNFFEIR